ncbi:peptidoglycan-binding domain-containing protein [Nostoc sp. 106C]|uniref:peptidoglycan-binding domain-containing protein n=1 Tax=Nostoc sp. 106C TaxID=1932667 RepID=UPI000A38091B|nr:peptidoglycan-binding domain-containing protein [Nostoc sp. 106C]OUL28219.1 hypothetical protein BV375_18600 [Nostoc sp. 106C]
MSERIRAQRQKAGTSKSTNPSLTSPTSPSLANLTRGFSLPAERILAKKVDRESSNPQALPSDGETLAEEASLQQPLSHDISRISLRPQARLTSNLEVQRFGDKDAELLTAAQVSSAKAYYASRSKQYTPEIITQIQQTVGSTPTGAIDDETIQAVAKWQQEHPPLKVDGKAGPRTLPAAFPTGLATTDATDEYVGEAKQVQADWAKLKTTNERADALLTVVNKQLTAAGVPACNKAIKDLGADAGQFDFVTWTLDLGKEAFSQASLTDEAAADIADTVYHESRHAEQWYMMAQMLAGKGKSAKAIAKEMDIPPNIASSAVNNPLKSGSMEALIAEGWYESVYGAKADYRDRVLTDLDTKQKALDKAKEQHDKSPTDANQAKLDKAQKQYDIAYEKYRDLPEEADAWRVGGAVTDAYLKK